MSSKTKNLRQADPHHAREAAKYEHPLPSREMILEVMAREGVPLAEDALAATLGIDSHELEAFSRRLAAMEREGQVMRNRRGAILVADKAGLVKGRVIGHPDGYGFLKPEDGGADLFLAAKQMHKALHGDIVLARVTGVDRRGRSEGSIVEVLERAHQQVVGRLFVEQGVMFIMAEDKRIAQDFLVPPDGSNGAKHGQVVVAEILQQPSPQSEPIARVVEILGNYADPGMEIEIALRKHDLPHVFSKEAEQLASKHGDKVAAKDTKGRKDLRALPFGDQVAEALDRILHLGDVGAEEGVPLESGLVLDDDGRNTETLEGPDGEDEVLRSPPRVAVVDDRLGRHLHDVVHGLEARGSVHGFDVGFAACRRVGQAAQP